jgi:hypothetical protein
MWIVEYSGPELDYTVGLAENDENLLNFCKQIFSRPLFVGGSSNIDAPPKQNGWSYVVLSTVDGTIKITATWTPPWTSGGKFYLP